MKDMREYQREHLLRLNYKIVCFRQVARVDFAWGSADVSVVGFKKFSESGELQMLTYITLRSLDYPWWWSQGTIVNEVLAWCLPGQDLPGLGDDEMDVDDGSDEEEQEEDWDGEESGKTHERSQGGGGSHG